MPCSIQNQLHHETCHKLHPGQYTDDYPSVQQMTTTPLLTLHITPKATPEHSEDEEEEDIQMVPLNDDHWASKEIPERTLCIHEHGLPHGFCPYPCPYANYQIPSYIDSLDLSDISEFEDYMVTSSNEDIPALEDTLY